MREFDYEIPEWEYNEYKQHPCDKNRRFLDRHGNYAWEYGYGFYGFELKECDGKYYAHCHLGSECE